jgi:hypothetical protein
MEDLFVKESERSPIMVDVVDCIDMVLPAEIAVAGFVMMVRILGEEYKVEVVLVLSDDVLSRCAPFGSGCGLRFGMTLPLMVWMCSLSAWNAVIDIVLSSCLSGTILPCAVVLEPGAWFC